MKPKDNLFDSSALKRSISSCKSHICSYCSRALTMCLRYGNSMPRSPSFYTCRKADQSWSYQVVWQKRPYSRANDWQRHCRPDMTNHQITIGVVRALVECETTHWWDKVALPPIRCIWSLAGSQHRHILLNYCSLTFTRYNCVIKWLALTSYTCTRVHSGLTD